MTSIAMDEMSHVPTQADILAGRCGSVTSETAVHIVINCIKIYNANIIN